MVVMDDETFAEALRRQGIRQTAIRTKKFHLQCALLRSDGLTSFDFVDIFEWSASCACLLEDRLKEFYPWFTRQNRNYELLYLVGGDTDAGIHCVTDHYNFVAVLLDLMQPTYRPDEPIQIRIRRKTSEFSTYYFNRDRMQELIDNNLAGFRLWQYINVYVHIQTDRGRQEWELERTNKRWLA